MKINKKILLKILIPSLSLILSALFIFLLISCCINLGLIGGTANTAVTASNEITAQNSSETASVQGQSLFQKPDLFIISELKVPGQAIDVKISGDYAYLTNDLGILYVIDISNKEKPEIIGKCPGIDSANVVMVQGDYAYISYTSWVIPETQSSETTGSSINIYSICGFKIIDISDKKNPEIVGDYISGKNEQKSVQGIFIKNNYAYLNSTKSSGASEEGSLEIINIENKKNPVLLSKCKIEGSPSGIFVEGNFVYINNDYFDYQTKQYKEKSKLFVVDVLDKKHPEVVGSCEVPANSWSVLARGNFAYATSSIYDENTKKYNNSVLQIIDIKNKNNPVLKGSCEVPDGAWEIDIKDNYLFVSNNAGGVNAIDISDANNPVIVNSLNFTGNSYDIVIEGDYGYVANGFGGFIIAGLQKKGIQAQNPQSENGTNPGNSAPIAEIKVSGDMLNTSSFIVENPVYFDGRDSYDPDSDSLTFIWKVNGNEIFGTTKGTILSGDKNELACIFEQPGLYNVTLTVYDGSLSNTTMAEIKVENQKTVINEIKRHDFNVEIKCILTNNSNILLKNIECYLRAPQTYGPYQAANNISTNISSVDKIFDDSWNLLYHFKFNGNTLKKGDKIEALIDSQITMYEYNFQNLKTSDLNYEQGDEDLITYTGDDLFIDTDNSTIQTAAKKVTGSETRPIVKARLLYNFVANKLAYDFKRAQDKNYKFMYASEILKTGKGVCADYAILYTALLRAAGIPSRVVGGIPVFLILGEKNKEIDVGHAWVELKLPGFGWIPVNITQEDGFMTADYYLDLATEKGSSFLYESQTMDWTSYYLDGFKFKWDGASAPSVDQKMLFSIKNLDFTDMSVNSG
ncbi:MAG: hypothetical protein M1409_02690 [Actinobacteria bacterium]|nr:hypothetical protein [Actinomycetota bacterium]